MNTTKQELSIKRTASSQTHYNIIKENVEHTHQRHDNSVGVCLFLKDDNCLRLSSGTNWSKLTCLSQNPNDALSLLGWKYLVWGQNWIFPNSLKHLKKNQKEALGQAVKCFSWLILNQENMTMIYSLCHAVVESPNQSHAMRTDFNSLLQHHWIKSTVSFHWRALHI